MRGSIATEPGEGQGGGGPPSQIRSFLKTRHEIVASGLILIDILKIDIKNKSKGRAL